MEVTCCTKARSRLLRSRQNWHLPKVSSPQKSSRRPRVSKSSSARKRKQKRRDIDKDAFLLLLPKTSDDDDDDDDVVSAKKYSLLLFYIFNVTCIFYLFFFPFFPALSCPRTFISKNLKRRRRSGEILHHQSAH